LVVLKIIKHCKENLPELATGQLLGLDVDEDVLEVTNCFPFPASQHGNSLLNQQENTNDEEVDASASATENLGAEYQIEMMRCLREVNVDNNCVGWYSSTYMGTFLNESAIETQYNYQERIKKSVVLIYDPVKTAQGVLSLKAYRLTQPFLELYRQQTFTKQSLAKANMTFNEIFEEVPIRISNSLLVKAFLFELTESKTMDSEFERLDLATNSFLEKNLECLIECLDDLSTEQNKLQFYQRNVQRQQVHQNAWLLKRKQENQVRKMNGEELLPEEDPTNPMFKPIAEPSRLDSLLITNQINNYCKQINDFSGNSFAKLFLAHHFQKS